VKDYETTQSARHAEKDFRMYVCRKSLRSTTGHLQISGKRSHKYYHYARPLTFGSHPQAYGKVREQFHVTKDLSPHTVWTVGGGPLSTIYNAWGALRKVDTIYDMNKVHTVGNAFTDIKERGHITAAIDSIPSGMWPELLSVYIALRHCRRLHNTELLKAKVTEESAIEVALRRLVVY
jgi:hypothetical protein